MRIPLVLASALFVTSLGAVNAGGLCGKGGLIRGDVGRLCDEAIEKPITTPLAKKATVVTTTAVGAVVGGAFGAAVGAHVGEQINQRAAGATPAIGRPAQHGINGATPGRAIFQMTNGAKHWIYVRLFSQDRSVIWPAQTAAFELRDREPTNLEIVCNVGEKICYGAYYSPNGTYWGSGANDEHACDDCCMRCAPFGSPAIKQERLID